MGGVANVTGFLRDDALFVWNRSTKQVLKIRARKPASTNRMRLIAT